MQLDVATIIVMVIVSSMLVGVILPTARDAREVPGFREATLASWLIAASFAAMLLRPRLPAAVAIVAGNGLLWVALALHLVAYRRFRDPSASPRGPMAAAAGLVAVFAAFTAAGAGYVARALFTSLVVAGFTAAGAWEIARDRGLREERSRLIGIGLGLLTCGCMVARVVILLRAGRVDERLLVPSLERSIGFFPAVLYTLAAGLGFLMMHRERSDARSRNLALTDPLTGCANRRALEERVRGELAFAVRSRSPVALIVVDLDRFKSINDAHGHAVGDAVIRHLAEVLRRGARASDTVARYGGEEFCVLMRNADAQGAEVLAERLRATLAGAPVAARGVTLRVTASFGVAAIDPAEPETWESVFRRADAALYAAKQAGRDRVSRG